MTLPSLTMRSSTTMVLKSLMLTRKKANEDGGDEESYMVDDGLGVLVVVGDLERLSMKRWAGFADEHGREELAVGEHGRLKSKASETTALGYPILRLAY